MRTRALTIQNLNRSGRRRRAALICCFIFAAAVVTALACGWNFYTDHSVRFNAMRKGRGFYRLPPLPIMYDAKTGKELTVAELGDDGYFEEVPSEQASYDDKLRFPGADIWDEARTAVEQGDLARAGERLNKFLAITRFAANEDQADLQTKRNTARDLLDAMTAMRAGSSVSSIKAYLEARYAFDDGFQIDTINKYRQPKIDRNLQDNWDYLNAALALRDSKEFALEAFRSHAAKYSRSEKNEAVLYMTAKLFMEGSHSFGNTRCGILGEDEWGEQIDPNSIEPAEKCRDENWYRAVEVFKRLMIRYPGGRYFNDARGWLAYLYRRGGERALALAEYYRLLGDRTDVKARLEAKKSLQMIGHKYDDATLDRVEELIAGEPDTALAYSYHRIYNHAVDLTYSELAPYYANDYSETGRLEKKRVVDDLANGKHELERVAKFASAMMKCYPNARVSGAFVLRVAQAQTELQNFDEAHQLARRALGLGLQSDMRAEALWIKGSAEHRRKDLKSADATFRQLVAEFPQSKLTEGARRLLALTAEDRGDLETALKLYLQLGYNEDVAYFVDVLLPTDRLAAFVAGNPDAPRRDSLLYALGVRYMRDRRWEDARATLRQVMTQPDPLTFDYGYEDTKRNDSSPKEPEYWSDREKYIKSSWVMQDLKTIDIFEQLERAVESAEGDEARAEAMYRLASYQFDGDSLLFYNPDAWEGSRSWLLSDLKNSSRFRLPGEPQILFEYSQSHETLARAISIYLDIVDRFPDTKAAKDALYSAAVAHERLSDLNPYWRSIYEKGLFAGSRKVTYTDVKRAYPTYQLPRGTDGWEASTRTVNGGSGWAPKPKPPPKLTLTQKIERRIKSLFDRVWPKAESSGSYIAAAVPGLLWEFVFAVLFALFIWSAVWIRVWRLPGQELPARSNAQYSSDPDSRLEKATGDQA